MSKIRDDIDYIWSRREITDRKMTYYIVTSKINNLKVKQLGCAQLISFKGLKRGESIWDLEDKLRYQDEKWGENLKYYAPLDWPEEKGPYPRGEEFGQPKIKIGRAHV